MTCNGINSKGEPCGLPAGWGTDNENYCRYHEDQGGLITLKIDVTQEIDPHIIFDTNTSTAIFLSSEDISYEEMSELAETVESGHIDGNDLTIPQ